MPNMCAKKAQHDMPHHLYRPTHGHSQNWYVRLVPPKEVQHLTGPKEFRKSTGTAEIKRAKTIGSQLVAQKRAEWDKLLTSSKHVDAPSEITLTQPLIDFVCAKRLYQWMHIDDLGRVEGFGMSDENLAEMTKMCQITDQAMRSVLARGKQSAEWDNTLELLDLWCEQIGYKFVQTDPLFPKLVREFARADKRAERHALKQAGYRAEWTAFWKELAERPALALAPGRVKGTLWNLSTVLSKRSRGSDRVRWDREYLEKCFTGPVTEAIRRSLMAYWRNMKPTLPSERKEKNTYLVVWTYGLMGLYAEAEDPRWTRSVSGAEADLAVRYALVELNGLPDWLAALADAHRQVVEQVLGGEIESELKGKGGDGGWHSMLLQSLRYGRIEVARVLERRLVLWLRGPGRKLMRARHTPVAEAKLDQVVRVLLVHGSPETKFWLMELATRELFAAKQGPYLFFWLPVLMRLNP